SGLGNQVNVLAANTGSVNFRDGRDLTIGAIRGVHGVTPTGAFPLDAPGHPISTGRGPAGGAPGRALFSLAGGSWVQTALALPSFGANDFRISGGSFLRVTGGDGSAAHPYQLADVYGLQGVSGFSTKAFVLAGDISAGGTANWNAGA